ncbi:MAG: deoxyribose-phosphate aldolase [Promethearchaeota archaeon]
MELAKMIDHTMLKPTATEEEIRKLCEEAIRYRFGAVCINPYYVSYVSQLLFNKNVKVCTVVGFPLGSSTSETKKFETEDAVENGVDEIDMVINLGALKSGDYDSVKKDIEGVVNASKDSLVKVIIEACYLNRYEKIRACELTMAAEADYVKTSTGFGSSGAKVEDVRLMRRIVGEKLGVKAAGGIGTYKEALEMIEAGASRIGASRGINILKYCPC